VTIATNMAGRGTDIVLGPGVAEAGGLHIIGTERHEARRIDNQLRGRAGRQGDPGSSRFYVSLEDELMRRFGSERIAGLMERFGMEEDVPIQHSIISKSIESAQTKVEGHNFDVRKHVVQYDDVMNRHREVIYADRREIVAGEDMSEKVAELIHGEIESIVDRHLAGKNNAEIDYNGVHSTYVATIPNGKITLDEIDGLSREELIEALIADAEAAYATVEEQFGPLMRTVERQIMLAVIDRLWVEHLTAMDDLREGVGLQAYGQRDPLVVYKTEGYKMFQRLLDNVQHDVVHTLFRVQRVTEQPVRTKLTEAATTTNREPAGNQPVRRQKMRPNDRCFCGSGKKYKFCHGAPAAKVTAV
jgi:preprotein translocase subunit SecA